MAEIDKNHCGDCNYFLPIKFPGINSIDIYEHMFGQRGLCLNKESPKITYSDYTPRQAYEMGDLVLQRFVQQYLTANQTCFNSSDFEKSIEIILEELNI